MPAQDGHLASSATCTAVSYGLPLNTGLRAPAQQELDSHLHVLSALYSAQPSPGVTEGQTNTGERMKSHQRRAGLKSTADESSPISTSASFWETPRRLPQRGVIWLTHNPARKHLLTVGLNPHVCGQTPVGGRVVLQEEITALKTKRRGLTPSLAPCWLHRLR